MNISDIIIKTAGSAKVKRYLAQITDYNGLCKLLMSYYFDILNLRPRKKYNAIDKEKLMQIVFTTFHRIDIENAVIEESHLTTIIVELLCRINQLHLKKYKENSGRFDKMLKDVVSYYCSICSISKDNFASLFLEEIEKYPDGRKIEEIIPTPALITYLSKTKILLQKKDTQVKKL
jgi:hypothetical protein